MTLLCDVTVDAFDVTQRLSLRDALRPGQVMLRNIIETNFPRKAKRPFKPLNVESAATVSHVVERSRSRDAVRPGGRVTCNVRVPRAEVKQL